VDVEVAMGRDVLSKQGFSATFSFLKKENSVLLFLLEMREKSTPRFTLSILH